MNVSAFQASDVTSYFFGTPWCNPPRIIFTTWFIFIIMVQQFTLSFKYLCAAVEAL